MFCDRCGRPDSNSGTAAAHHAEPAIDHAACHSARALEPPRYCQRCARRMVVQVVPTGWTARCVEHGTSTSVLA